jgi:2-alkenal reductase
MRKIILLSIFMMILWLAGCQTNQTNTTPHVPSTPLDALANDAGQTGNAPTPVPAAIIDQADAEYRLLTNIYERIAPSVVNIEVVATPDIHTGRSAVSNGSGFMVDQAGHIVTNTHVVDGAAEIRVTFEDGYVTDARLVGQDVYSDIAVIKVDVDESRLFPLTFADSDLLQVGQRAIAIGNPFGLSSSMTVGIVSGLGRQLSSATLIDNTISPGFQNPHIIQVDTDINPGNSGGPLLNSQGEVIGVNTAISTENGIFQGVGFAVPANTVQRVVPELIADGRVDYSWIGIVTINSEITLASLQESLGLAVSKGVLITGVTPNSPASDAGLLGGAGYRTVRGDNICAGGDIIIAVDDYYIEDMDEFVAYLIVNTVPGDTITLLIVRNSETFNVPVALRSRPAGGVDLTDTCGR